MRLIDADAYKRELINRAIHIKAEIARQIFAELESVATINTHTSDIKISACNYAEVKNKYTRDEEKENV